DVRLVGTHLDSDVINSLRESGTHPKLGLELPKGLKAFPISELTSALEGAEGIGLGVSSHGVRWAAETLAPYFIKRAISGAPAWPVMSISKGPEWTGEELRLLPDEFSDALKAAVDDADGAYAAAPVDASAVAVAGPCIAGGLARRGETCVLMTSRSPERPRRLAALVRTPYYHAFPS